MGRLGGTAVKRLPSAQGAIPALRDQAPHQAPLLGACFFLFHSPCLCSLSHWLSFSLLNKLKTLKNKQKRKTKRMPTVATVIQQRTRSPCNSNQKTERDKYFPNQQRRIQTLSLHRCHDTLYGRHKGIHAQNIRSYSAGRLRWRRSRGHLFQPVP